MAYCERCSRRIAIGPHCRDCLDTLRRAAEYDREVTKRFKPGDSQFDLSTATPREIAEHRRKRRALQFGSGQC